jgi:hypothetical protein
MRLTRVVEVAESIRKILFELLANAIIHGAEDPELRVANGKPATARVRCEILSTAEGTSIRVTDDGSGFEKNAHHPPRKGGLRRARKIVERELGGTLRITSRADGVTALLELPALHGLYRALIVRRHGTALILPSAPRRVGRCGRTLTNRARYHQLLVSSLPAATHSARRAGLCR